MSKYAGEYHWLKVSGDAELFTMVFKPSATGKFPVVVTRTPYDSFDENRDPKSLVSDFLEYFSEWLDRGYCLVYQHTRGKGGSTGEFIPYINEQSDGHELLNWIRKQDFYNGEIYFSGLSYLCSVFLSMTPYADDIKGAIFKVQDSERYRIFYRNGNLINKKWYFEHYKSKQITNKNYENISETLPYCNAPLKAFGEHAEVYEEIIKNPDPNAEFWKTHEGGSDARGCTDNVQFPILFTTGFYDFYTGGIFDMWNSMSAESKKRSAFIVSPYDHNDRAREGLEFPDAHIQEHFGKHFEIDWFDFIRNKKESFDAPLGKVTYYRIFENKWHSEDFCDAENQIRIPLGNGEKTYTYDPYDAPEFPGGVSGILENINYFQPAPNQRDDIITIYTDKFSQDTFVKGKMRAKLSVKSDCEDTCFYIRISITRPEGDYGLRADIQTLCHQLGDYTKNTEVELLFECDEHAFLISKGERLRIDIASADKAHYIRHTNQKGLFSEISEAKSAKNTVNLAKSYLVLPTE